MRPGLMLARQCKKRYRERGVNPRQVSAANTLPPGHVWTLGTAPVVSPSDRAMGEPLESSATELVFAEPSQSATDCHALPVLFLRMPPVVQQNNLEDDSSVPYTPLLERSDQRLFRERGPIRRAQLTGFRIQLTGHPSRAADGGNTGRKARGAGVVGGTETG